MSRYYTVGGLKFSDAKSGLQKAIRRGLLYEALMYAVEMDRYPFGEQKGNRTNLINRLKIILVEDVCSPEIIPTLSEWFEKWHSLRETKESRVYLLSIVKSLVEAPKLRLLSDYKFFIDPEDYRKNLGTKYDFLYTDGSTFEDPNYLRGKIVKDSKTYIGFGHHYDKYFKKIFDTFPKTNKESWLYSLASYVYKRDSIPYKSIKPSLYSEKEVDCIYELQKDVKFPYKCGWLPENIVCDIHTGKQRTADSLHYFAIEGARIENERSDFLIPELRFLYNENKRLFGSNHPVTTLKPKGKWNDSLYKKVKMTEESESSEIENSPIRKKSYNLKFLDNPLYAQKVTTSYKPFTFLTREKVFKGPFTEKRSDVPDVIIHSAKRFLDLGDDSVLIPEKVLVKNKGYLDGIYLVYKNIGEHWNPITFEDVIKKYPKDHEPQEVRGKLVDRKSVGIYQGADLIKMGKMDYEKLFYHMCIRYILGRGDASLTNFINNYGVDFDDQRTEKSLSLEGKTNLIQIIFTKPPKEKDILLKEINKVKGKLKKRLELIKKKLEDKEIERYNVIMARL